MTRNAAYWDNPIIMQLISYINVRYVQSADVQFKRFNTLNREAVSPSRLFCLFSLGP